MNSDKRIHPVGRLVLFLLMVGIIVIGYQAYRWFNGQGRRAPQVFAWLRDPQSYKHWAVKSGQRCGAVPFAMPTDGFIGFLWGDSFRPGHRHQGLDIFGGEALNQTPVIAAYPGYLSRLPDWKSSIIIRIPDDPLMPSRQIWTYYTHMADQEGNSYIVPEFPAGTHEVFVEAGTLLGYQGNFSGDPNNPVGIHLHFSIVKDDGRGKFQNELEFSNTIDPSPYLGLPVNAEENQGDIPVCPTVVESS